ncbi:class I SAM-dependent methyltransferase [Algoriphagus antarcticus]|uniref:Methyltransferase family protein n=1 Tax=Algoriphagus antarcticus TaxID=238540 RepID=A0A3E0D4R3_9BACT|nr:hypothetical protein [Algoriphagus antarcticus]REG77483.1 hypothetical protein C8N25_1449 [Algoriphagus antarcticus]
MILSKFINLNKKASLATYKLFSHLFGPANKCELDYYDYLKQFEFSTLTVLELGGTQRPIFNKSEVKQYIGLDIDKDFNWENHYHVYLNQSCTDPINIKADIIISKYLLEHVDDNKKTFQNIIDCLNNSGSSIHVFPLGFHPYSLITKLIGNKTQKSLIKLLRPEAEEISGYPVYYNLCNSFSLEKHLKTIEGVSFEVRYYYGASEYFFSFYPAYLFIEVFNRVFHMLKIKIFASNAVVIIKK